MWKVALKGITQRKRRFFSTIVAIVLSVGFLSGVSILSDTIRQTFDSLFSSVYGGTDAVVVGKGTLDGGFRRAPKRLPRSTIESLRAVPGVAAVDGLVQSYAQVVDRDGVPIGGSNAPTFGSAWTNDQELNPFSISSGRAPAADGEIAVDGNTAKLGKIQLGDKVQVLTLSEPVTDTVVGITRFGKADSPAGFGFTHFTAAEADRLFKTGGMVDQILVAAAPGVSQDALAASVSAALGNDPNLEVFTGQQATLKRQSEFKERLKAFTVFLNIFALVAMFVATFVIFNTFQIILSQRQREMALLRALGAGRWQLLRSVVLESLVIGLVASLIGIAVGGAVAFSLKALLTAVGFPLAKGALVLARHTVTNGIIAGIVSTLVAAVVPALRASRIAPMAALQDAALEHRRPSIVRIGLSFAVLAGAAWLLVTGLRTSGNPAVQRVGLSAGATVIGLLLLNPALLVPFTRSIGSTARVQGVPGQLAQENVVRSPRRNALTAFPLLFGAALVGLLLVFTASFKSQVAKTVEGQFKGDFFVNTKGRGFGFSPEVAKAVAKVPGVEALTPVRFFFGDAKLIDAEGQSDESAFIAVDTHTVLQTVDIPVTAGSIQDMPTGTIAISSTVAKKKGWTIGEDLTLRLRGNDNRPLRVAAVIDASKVAGLFQGAGALLGIDTFEPFDPFKLDQVVYVKTAASERNNIAAMKQRLSDAVKQYPTVEVGDLASYKKLISAQVAPFVNFILGLLCISVLIAIVGVANTMKLSVAERTRELGVLRAVGMHRRQSRAMVRWEAITISVFGVLIGIAIGAGFGVALMRTLRSQGFTESVLPIRQFIVMGIVAAVLGLVAATGAARRVGRLDILRAIAIE